MAETVKHPGRRADASSWPASRISFILFAAIAVLLSVVHTNWVVLTNDEGIILNAAQRMYEGARPYVDFFGYMSPGSYWLQEAMFQVGGISLFTGRLLVILDFAAQCGLLFFLTARLASKRVAAVTTLVFFGFQLAEPAMLTAQHRWDSGTFVLAALCILLVALEEPPSIRRRLKLAGCGLLLATATWSTPSMLAVAGTVIGGLLWAPRWRAATLPVAGGYAVGGIAGIIALAVQGNLVGFLEQIAWLREHYANVNIMPYGSVIGGYGQLLDGTGAMELGVRAILVLAIALPAILPPLALLLWGWMLWKRQIAGESDRSGIILLLAAVLALVTTIFPRADVAHLGWVAAVPYALAGAGIARVLPERAAGLLGTFAVLLSLLFASNYALQRSKAVPASTAVGPVVAEPELAQKLEALNREVQPGDSMFVYPYMPVLYFLTQTENPSEFSYLAPGMMTRTEELRTLEQLRRNPPNWILYFKLTEEELRRVFPNAPADGWRFTELEHWLEAEYAPNSADAKRASTRPEPAISIAGYQLWRRRDRSSGPQQTAQAR